MNICDNICDNPCEGPEITHAEVGQAIKAAKIGKSAGPDDVYSEVLKLFNDQSTDKLVSLFNAIYVSGKIPSDWLESVFVTLPKKTWPKTYGDYRMISIMSHTLKIFLKIIQDRLYRKCKEHLSDTQFGFCNGLGTREALFSIQVLIQRCRDMSTDVYACFLDYQKAFDCVDHGKLINILQNMNLDGRDVRIIKNLYYNQIAAVKVEDMTTEYVPIQRGVRQGCVLSPLLFNIYSEQIFADALDEAREGIVVNGEVINNLRYADDTVLLAGSADDLQALLDRVVAKSEERGLKLNISKTKAMVISKNGELPANLSTGNQQIQQVSSFRYLGCLLNSKWDSTQEIRSRIEQARAAFSNMKKVLTSRDLSIPLRIRLLRCYVFPILYYGMEGWTLTKAMCSRIEAFEMWCYRRLLRISWVDRVRNTEVLARLQKQLEVMFTIKKRKLEYFGHVMRGEKYRILQNIMQGKIQGRRCPGRRRTSWLKNLREWYGVNSTSLFRAAANKIKIIMMIADVLGGHGT